MLQPLPFANAATVVSLVLYVICRALTLLAPDLVFAIGRSLFHTLNVDAMKATTAFDLGSFVIGAVTLAIVVWVSAYALAAIYNRFSQ